jgi:hypothetical protein
MAASANPADNSNLTPVYHIRIQGHLSPRWETWFDPMSISLDANGESLLTGPVVDQAALHGLIRKLSDLGLPLLSITRVEPQPDRP